MKKKMSGSHTGPIMHKDMTSHPPPHPGRDKHAHESHHATSKEYDGAGDIATSHEEEMGEDGGEGMAGNACCE